MNSMQRLHWDRLRRFGSEGNLRFQWVSLAERSLFRTFIWLEKTSLKWKQSEAAVYLNVILQICRSKRPTLYVCLTFISGLLASIVNFKQFHFVIQTKPHHASLLFVNRKVSFATSYSKWPNGFNGFWWGCQVVHKQFWEFDQCFTNKFIFKLEFYYCLI